METNEDKWIFTNLTNEFPSSYLNINFTFFLGIVDYIKRKAFVNYL